MKLNIKIPVIAGIMVTGALCNELPVCEEYAGESGISCVAGDSVAVITTIGESGKTVELYRGWRKAYVEYGTDGSVWASTGRIRYELSGEEVAACGEECVDDMLAGVLADLGF